MADEGSRQTPPPPPPGPPKPAPAPQPTTPPGPPKPAPATPPPPAPPNVAPPPSQKPANRPPKSKPQGKRRPKGKPANRPPKSKPQGKRRPKGKPAQPRKGKKRGGRIKIKLGLRAKKLAEDTDTYTDQIGWTTSASETVLSDLKDAEELVKKEPETLTHHCTMCGSRMEIPRPKRDRYKVICAHPECGHEDRIGF